MKLTNCNTQRLCEGFTLAAKATSQRTLAFVHSESTIQCVWLRRDSVASRVVYISMQFKCCNLLWSALRLCGCARCKGHNRCIVTHALHNVSSPHIEK
jgi:hypothetical protein